ncbi:hypothetical protein FA10DRAFT_97309 [Acaromyces ingoldii]|uniref:Uncharacterized protein n=1 Tax=Acaromyces ingoldii TaxID=215250 RepID=A0A316YNZ5_9BASI|nr:hypothetical protein FA10DRAFT_97309 [Acaromyces ingoldii]PWN89773.1 hypothetical protein FA10DRAFT_97309 [Acaromyces ingoldii]
MRLRSGASLILYLILIAGGIFLSCGCCYTHDRAAPTLRARTRAGSTCLNLRPTRMNLPIAVHGGACHRMLLNLELEQTCKIPLCRWALVIHVGICPTFAPCLLAPWP